MSSPPKRLRPPKAGRLHPARHGHQTGGRDSSPESDREDRSGVDHEHGPCGSRRGSERSVLGPRRDGVCEHHPGAPGHWGALEREGWGRSPVSLGVRALHCGLHTPSGVVSYLDTIVQDILGLR